MSDSAKLIIALIVLVLPFQLLGVAAYFMIVKSSVRNAHIAGALVPTLAFFSVMLAWFLWSYYHPTVMMLVDGAVNLVILALLIGGTLLHFIGGTIVYFILYKRQS